MDVSFFIKYANDVVLEVEIHPNSAQSFEDQYYEQVGVRPELGVGYQHQPNKWGKECRIYFNSENDLFDEFANIGVNVETGRRPYRSRWRYRVNNCEFFDCLIQNNYRLGEN